jgi:hypothetical protein
LPFTVAADPNAILTFVASRPLQGWQPDPFGLHEMRYFSVGNPTKLVRDGRTEAYDEPPANSTTELPESAEPEASQAAASARATTGGVLVASANAVRPTGVESTARPSARVQSAHVPPARVPPARRRRREYVAVAAGAVVAVLVFVALGGTAGKPGISPAAFVTKAAQRTLAETTADVTLDGTLTSGSQQLTMHGHGQVNLASGATTLELGATVAGGGSISETELQVGGNLYVQLIVNRHALALGGRHWIELPFIQSSGRSATTGSPTSSLALLSQQGSRVVPLGASSIGGQTCDGYSVTPSQQAMVASVRRESSELGYSATEAAAVLKAIEGTTPPTITVWFNPASQLACQLTMYMQFGTPTSATSGGMQAIMTFTDYGTPVTITQPPAADTVSLQQFLTTGHA